MVKALRKKESGCVLRRALHILSFVPLPDIYFTLRTESLPSCNDADPPCALVRICVIAGNVTPIDVITHIPILCEEADVPYIYVPSKEALGTASCTKRPTSVILVKPKKGESYMELMEKVQSAVAKLAPSH